MRTEFLTRLTMGRIQLPGYPIGDNHNGAFILKSPTGRFLQVVTSDGEEWEMVKGFESLYAVSNQGKVVAFEKTVALPYGGERKHTETLLSQEILEKGHKRVTLTDGATKVKAQVHRLVAEAFIPNPHDYPIVNHIDSNPANNIVTNLEWCTHAYNVHHAIENGRMRGVNLVEREAILKRIEEGATVKQVAEELGYNKGTISHAKLRKYNANAANEHTPYTGMALWEHVSVSILKNANTTPTWEEMAYIKSLCFTPQETVMQLHVPDDQHINLHPGCLHLWRPQFETIPQPPAFMVGPTPKAKK